MTEHSISYSDDPCRTGPSTNLAVTRVGVIGSGQIGPDIALFFAKALHRSNVAVVVVDVSPEALEKGRAKLKHKVSKGRDTGAFTPRDAAAMTGAVTFTTDYTTLAGAELVIEAATENLDIKRQIFAKLESICGREAILASNSSHLEPEQIFGTLRHRDRSLVIHYFFPAERNPLVEIVPGGDTDPVLTDRLMAFYESIGKVPVHVASRFGFAVNPVFEGLFLAAALAVEAGAGTVKQVDAVSRRALGLGVGPFTAMNLTGGNPITHHALEEMGDRFGAWWRSPQLMRDAMSSRIPWDVATRDEQVELPAAQEQRIADSIRGAYFGLAGQIVDAGIVSLADLELAVETGLDMRPPFASMNHIGVSAALDLVERYSAQFSGFAVPRCLTAQAGTGKPFVIDYVSRHDDGDVAILTIRRPRVLNALNEDVYVQLTEHFATLKSDPRIAAVVLKGFGTKAFVSGADVRFLGNIASPEDGFTTSQRSKEPGNLIEHLGKPVVCALNGMALGGGNELAMCCTARISRAGVPMLVAQPEANLGIVPGAGGTQRLPRLVGLTTAAEMLRTGRPLSSREAVECGLVHAEVEGDLISAAVSLARAIANGAEHVTSIDAGPMVVPDSLPPVELGHRSMAIDALICRAILEGCAMPLAEGLRFESQMFGACCATEDMRIGVRNFVENGPRAKAAFVHA